MSATNQNGIAPKSIASKFRKCWAGRKPCRKSSSKSNRGRSNLQFEGLEKREMFSINSVSFAPISSDLRALNPNLFGPMVVVTTDNASTSVEVTKIDSQHFRIREVGTRGLTLFSQDVADNIGAIKFQGGTGNDKFINTVSTLAVHALGGGGNDTLEGNGRGDILEGGAGDDMLLGKGANDRLLGGKGNDHLDGGSGNDSLLGEDGDDVLLGGTGADSLFGGAQNDRLNGQAGSDTMFGDAGDDVLISIDAAFGDVLISGTGRDAMWIDSSFLSSDSVLDASLSDIVQRVGSFANGGDRTLDGDNLADPGDIGAKRAFDNIVTAGNTQGSNPLFASGGPTSSDIRQGALGDCWLLAGLGAIANNDPNTLRQNVVDFDDGTYGVRLGDSFYRVDNELPVMTVVTTKPLTVQTVKSFAGFGAENSMWVAAVEKAFAHDRFGLNTNTFSSLEGGNMTEVFSAFRMKNVGSQDLLSYGSAEVMALVLDAKMTQGFSLTIDVDIDKDAPEIADAGLFGVFARHAFTVERFIRNEAGTITDIVLRNPWGRDALGSFKAAFSMADGGADPVDAFDGVFTVPVNMLFVSGGVVQWGQV